MSYFTNGSRVKQTSEANPGGSLALARWLAFRDLFSPLLTVRVLGTVFVIALLAVAIYVALASLGDVESQRRTRQEQHDRLPNYLWNEETSARQRFSPDRLRELDTAIRAELAAAADVLIKCVPFDDGSWDWKAAGDESRKLWGRTVHRDDPVWAHVTVRWLDTVKRPPTGLKPGEDGVIITEQALRDLKFPTDPPPTELEVLTEGATRRPIKVLGVARGAEFLPNARFALTETAWKQLLEENPHAPVQTIESGPLPFNFPEAADLPKQLQNDLGILFGHWGVQWPSYVRPDPPTEGVPRHWRLQYVRNSDYPSWQAWKVFLTAAQKKLTDAKIAGAESFAKAEVPREVFVERPRRGYDRVGVWLRDPAYLRRAADAARKLDLPLDEGPIRAVEILNQEVELLEQRARQSSLAFAGAYAVVLVLVYGLRVVAQVRHLALLQAVGVSRGTLILFYLCQGLVIWLIGLVLGGGIALLRLGVGLGSDGLLTLWQGWWITLLLYAVGSLLLTLAGLVGCASLAILRSPARSLSRG